MLGAWMCVKQQRTMLLDASCHRCRFRNLAQRVLDGLMGASWPFLSVPAAYAPEQRTRKTNRLSVVDRVSHASSMLCVVAIIRFGCAFMCRSIVFTAFELFRVRLCLFWFILIFSGCLCASCIVERKRWILTINMRPSDRDGRRFVLWG